MQREKYELEYVSCCNVYWKITKRSHIFLYHHDINLARKHIMTSQNTTGSYRRSVLKGAAVMVGGTLPTVGTTTAKPNRAGKDQNWTPLEENASKVAYLTYELGLDGFGFPDEPEDAVFVEGSPQFDTTALKMAKNGKHIRHSLPFPGGKPYIIKHKGDGRYSPHGAVINFEVENNEYGLPNGRYRATVREEVQLYKKGGYFDWSVSRVDLFTRPGMDHVGSSLAVIWDEDGKENDDEKEYRNDPSTTDPETLQETLENDEFSELNSAAIDLVSAEIPNPGGK